MFEYFVAVFILLYVIYWAQTREYTKMIDHFPGPKKWPIFGNVLEWSFDPSEKEMIYLLLLLTINIKF